MSENRIDQAAIPRSPKPIERWGYETHLKEYLLLLSSRGSQALERTGMYPEKMELGKTWHEVLEDMRASTLKDGKEKWVFAGVKAERRGIFFPTIPMSGTNDYVPGNLMRKMKNWAKDERGIVDFVGDIHSHPTSFAESLTEKIARRLSGDKNLVELFSAGDFYAFLASLNMYFMGVVAGDYNVFTFKARESVSLGVGNIFTQDEFEKYWYEKFGFKYLGSAKEHGAFRAKRVSRDASQKDVNIEIARKHSLLIYQGRANKDLTKVFPR